MCVTAGQQRRQQHPSWQRDPRDRGRERARYRTCLLRGSTSVVAVHVRPVTAASSVEGGSRFGADENFRKFFGKFVRAPQARKFPEIHVYGQSARSLHASALTSHPSNTVHTPRARHSAHRPPHDAVACRPAAAAAAPCRSLDAPRREEGGGRRRSVEAELALGHRRRRGVAEDVLLPVERAGRAVRRGEAVGRELVVVVVVAAVAPVSGVQREMCEISPKY